MRQVFKKYKIKRSLDRYYRLKKKSNYKDE